MTLLFAACETTTVSESSSPVSLVVNLPVTVIERTSPRVLPRFSAVTVVLLIEKPVADPDSVGVTARVLISSPLRFVVNWAVIAEFPPDAGIVAVPAAMLNTYSNTEAA